MLIKYIFALFLLALGASCAPGSALIGAKQCTWGPSYWCKNLTSAHGCHAVPHCITNVWEHQTVENDSDDICTLCKNMVTEARNQLESNMTMDELKQVFEGTCKLMYVKKAVEICDKLADELVPELVETLSSQMNPDVVCSVAGLCNNAELDHEITLHQQQQKQLNAVPEKKPSLLHPQVKVSANSQANCNICSKFVNQTSKTISSASSSDIMEYLIDLCGRTSSYADSCASIVLMNFDSIESAVRKPIPHDQFCYLSGSCLSERTPLPGDETCDLCKQLVLHFKDIVTANTTALEFKKVLHGICKQTGKFRDECDSIVEEYSEQLFNIISNDLDGQAICQFVSICPAPGVYVNGKVHPMMPPAPQPYVQDVGRVAVSNEAIKVRVINDAETPRPTIAYGDPINSAALPEHLLIGKPAPPPSLLDDTKVNGQQECVFCQYALHYIQKVITQPYGEDAIKKAVDELCDAMPKSLSNQCRQFVELYGDAFVALLAQEIDPSQVCPSLKLCPAQQLTDHYEATALIGKPGCALCLMAISYLDDEIANNKTEASIQASLDKLCTKLPKSLVQQCDDLVKTYSEQLVDMLLADFTPEEVCAYLKICKKPPPVDIISTSPVPYEILTNEVGLPEENEKHLTRSNALMSEEEAKWTPQCTICEFVMEKVADVIMKNKTQNNIDEVVRGICSVLPKTVKRDCDLFVVKYAEEVINTLALMVAPAEACSYMGLCMKTKWMLAQQQVTDCAICQEVAQIQYTVMHGQDIGVDRANFLMNVCDGIEDSDVAKCRNFMRRYGVTMFNAFINGAPSNDVCNSLSICSTSSVAKIEITGDSIHF